VFICDKCQKTSKEGEKANKVFIFRDRSYENKLYEFDPKTRKKKETKFVTQGKEIERELNYCGACHSRGE